MACRPISALQYTHIHLFIHAMQATTFQVAHLSKSDCDGACYAFLSNACIPVKVFACTMFKGTKRISSCSGSIQQVQLPRCQLEKKQRS